MLQIKSPLPMRYSVMLGAKFAFEETSSGVVIYRLRLAAGARATRRLAAPGRACRERNQTGCGTRGSDREGRLRGQEVAGGRRGDQYLGADLRLSRPCRCRTHGALHAAARGDRVARTGARPRHGSQPRDFERAWRAQPRAQFRTHRPSRRLDHVARKIQPSRDRNARCPGRSRRVGHATICGRAPFRAVAGRAPARDRQTRRLQAQLFRLGRRAAARTAARSQSGRQHRYLLFQSRHLRARSEVPRSGGGSQHPGQRLAGPQHDPGVAGGAAEPAVHASAASGGLDHARAVPGGAVSSRRTYGTGGGTRRGSDHRHPAPARTAGRQRRKCRDPWRAGAGSGDGRRGAAGPGDGRGDRAGRNPGARRPADDPHAQSRDGNRRSAGRRLSRLLPAVLCDGLRPDQRSARRSTWQSGRGAGAPPAGAVGLAAPRRESSGRGDHGQGFPQRRD